MLRGRGGEGGGVRGFNFEAWGEHLRAKVARRVVGVSPSCVQVSVQIPLPETSGSGNKGGG